MQVSVDMPHVKNLIASHPGTWLEVLIDKYKIAAVWDNKESPRLVSLKYNMIESPMEEPIVQECRGMVVDTVSNQILVHGYNKFFNFGEGNAAPVDWATARVLEKVDGSLMQLYWDPTLSRWSVASSGNPIAGGTVWPGDQTFSALFWEVFHSLGMNLPSEAHKGTCFMFELCTSANRIVVRHEKSRIICHGARTLDTEREWSLDEISAVCQEYQWEPIKSFPYHSAEASLEAANGVNPLESEGFVVVDASFNRVKIKSPRYVALHHLKDGHSNRRTIELWKVGELDELLTYFPELEPDITPIVKRLEYIALRASLDVNSYGSNDRKAFAMEVKDQPWSAICFKLYSIREQNSHDRAKAVMRELPVSAMERMLDAVDADSMNSWYYPSDSN